jgi:hypothetical protein
MCDLPTTTCSTGADGLSRTPRCASFINCRSSWQPDRAAANTIDASQAEAIGAMTIVGEDAPASRRRSDLRPARTTFRKCCRCRDLPGIILRRGLIALSRAQQICAAVPSPRRLQSRAGATPDEVGAMARAVEVFRGAIAKRETEDELRVEGKAERAAGLNAASKT